MPVQTSSVPFMADRIGITMRVAESRHGETRDCLARDWGIFMSRTLPHAIWMPIPNLGELVTDLAQELQLDGLIFTGGNDIGSCLQRDLTEQALLNHAIKSHLPVLGVCRGLQLLQHHFKGQLVPCEPSLHVAVEHPISSRNISNDLGIHDGTIVNSYHNWAIQAAKLAPALELLATSPDGCVEAARHREAPITAIQWHPERDNPASTLDKTLAQTIFGGGIPCAP